MEEKNMDNRAEDIEKTDNFKLEIYFLFIILEINNPIKKPKYPLANPNVVVENIILAFNNK